MTASAPVTETGSDRVETTAADRASRRGWPGGALVLAALVVVPIGFLAIGILDPETEVWRQQWDTRLPGQLVDTAVLLVGVSFGALFLGTSLAWLVSAYRFPGSKAFGWLLVAPLAMPSYVLGFVTMSVFGFTGPVQNQWRDWFGRDAWFPEVESMGGAIVVFTLVLYPYVFLLARAALADQAGSAYNVARSLGAGPLEAARRVVIPMLRPALAAGVAVVMMETITDFATVQYFGVDTVTVGVFRINLSYLSSWSGVRALLDSSSSSTKSISRGHFINVVEDGFVQIAGGKLTGFRIIAQEALQRIFNKDFDLEKLKFVDDIMNLSETYKEDQFTFTVKHYCVTKPTDYLLRRTHISWFNENGGIKSLKKITDKFYSNTQYVESYAELVEEGLID